MKTETKRFIQSKFAEFYDKEGSRIVSPTSIAKREFGFFLFQSNIVVRHRGFADIEALRSFIKETVPSHAYYSTAYYERPEENMEEKGWLGADLYFDIDADHIPTKCNKVHDIWTCVSCGFAGKGIPPEKCPICDKQRFDSKTWPCETCLESAKWETMKLIDMLTKDFGLSLGEMEVSFSGHRGYHVHVESEEILEMDSKTRKEMVDYVTGTGLEAQYHGLEKVGRGRQILTGPGLKDFGWRGRIARGTYQFLKTAKKKDLQDIGLKRKTINAIISNREVLLESWKTKGPWSLVKGVGLESWNAIIKRVIESQSAKIDTVVTTDVHRLIRLTGTLHGKTGLMKVSFSATKIKQFDPLKSAIAFKEGEATIFVEEAPQFRIGEETFGPFKKQKVELPMAAALLLLCKGMAQVAE